MAHKELVTTIERTYTVVFQPCGRGYGYTATCLALPGLVSEGDTLDEARANASEAIKLYLESLQEDGIPIPPSEEDLVEPIRVSVAQGRRFEFEKGGAYNVEITDYHKG